MSRQREVILEELTKLKTHPTADELFPLVRKRIPNISLATVYRNLNWLAENGQIARVQYSGLQKRFDGDREPHYHFVCKECNKIYDIHSAKKMVEMEQVSSDLEKHQVEGFNIEFFGVCYLCQLRDNKGEKR